MQELRELTKRGTHERCVNVVARRSEFEKQFSDIALPDDLFMVDSKGETHFDKYCKKGP